jgi:hypothetical protein
MLCRFSLRLVTVDTEDRGSSLLQARAGHWERHHGDVRSQDRRRRQVFLGGAIDADYSKLIISLQSTGSSKA